MGADVAALTNRQEPAPHRRHTREPTAMLLPAGIDGLGDMYRLADRMLALGYTERAVNGLFYDNAAAFIRRML